MPGTASPTGALVNWIALCASGEAIGIAVVAATYAVIDRGQLEPVAIWILVAGAGEGFALGTAQSLWLRNAGVRPGAWIVLTIAGAVAGYGLSVLARAGGADTEVPVAEPSFWMIAGFGGLLGLAMGILMGAVQSPALRSPIRVWHWIAANVIGWMPAMAVIMLAASTADAEWSLVQVALLGACAGAIAGAAVGVATLFPLKQVSLSSM